MRKILLFVLFLVFSLSALANEGLANEGEIIAPQVTTPPQIDGVIGVSEWQGAAEIKAQFIDRFTGVLMRDTTEVFVQQHKNILYIGFICHDSKSGAIVAKIAKDQADIASDDTFGLEIDLFHKHLNVSWFCVNPIGTKMWYIAGGTASKVEWAGQWTAACQVTETGWQGEMAIPLEVIPHPKELKIVGVNFNRRQQWSNTFGDWQQEAIPGRSIYDVDTEKMGHLLGVKLIGTRYALNAMPYIYAGERYDKEWSIAHREGMDIKAPLTSTITAVASIFSDEENVEQEVEGIDFEYGKRWVPERRPSWQEGAGYRETYGAFDSGTIGRTHIGANIFGKPTPKTSANILTAYNRDEGTVTILSAGGNINAKTGGSSTFVNHSGRDISLLQVGMGTKTGKDGWFSTGGNITAIQNRKEDVVGERWLQHITVNLRNFTLKTVPYYTSGDYLNPVGFESYIGIYGARSYTWAAFKHEKIGWWGSLVKESEVGVQNETGNYDNHHIFRRTYAVYGILKTRTDRYLQATINAGQYGERREGEYIKYTDGTTKLVFRGRISDPKTNYGITMESGLRQEEFMAYVSAYGSFKVGKLTSALEIAKKWHLIDEDLLKLTFAYEFTKAIGVYGRLIHRINDENLYFGLRKSGYAGTDIHVIIGAPNRIAHQKTLIQKRMVLKLVRPFSLHF